MRNKRSILFLLIGVALLLLLGACASPVTTQSSGLTPLQVLQNSQKAMSQLKSAHVVLQLKGSGQASSAATTPTTGTPTTSGGLNFSLTGNGDEALPGQEQMNLTLTQSVTNSTNAFTEILSGGKLYAQVAGQWYEVNLASSGVSNPFPGLGSINLEQLLGLLDHLQITDHGDQTLNGVSLRHLTFKLDKYALEQLLDSNQQLVSMLGQQNINTAINNTTAFNASLDLWIDETQFYVHRTEMKLNLNANPSSLAATVTPTSGSPLQPLIPASVLTNMDSIVDLSLFNEPVTITPPASATPVTLPDLTPTP